MKLLTTVAGIFIIGSVLCTGYKQNTYMTCELYTDNSVNIVEKSINKDLKYLKEDLILPQFQGGKNAENVNKINLKINNDIMPKLNEAEKTATDYYGNLNAEEPAFPFQVYSRYTVTKDGRDIISFYNDYYEFLGGAHGLTTRTSYTIDENLERILNLNEIFKKGYDYKSVINDEIKKQISKEPDKYFETADKFKGISDNQGYYISNDNIVIYYQVYEIAPYVAGIPEFNIPIDMFGDNYKYRD
ncbi:DUF3298 and DUF4163 domain-containing protein [uncultured Clostridium sp.]|uniref:DUF3298 and DUF4163 domain-containing protein n=1 Tax=uncultured Clostridium sp. TaxID=59620 RepID=UPI0025E183E5|nr:DUF3298 and DUF4163 domain-containing protein [uncultured Clostridium sp.]